ncbi:DUF4252 domain-containing protein [Flexithrix dorotheae]|uniref:DUF4252 domain-containing protein n=1 Tax=Flexithrix dorotheae TaxID=70993 RepID=UPI000374CB22|nr:DUF4252 domain-containing protein [Flexithrix dorotheae]
MKKSFLIAIFFIFSGFFCFGQSKSISQFFDNHQGDDNLFTMSFSGNFLQSMFENESGEDEVEQAIKGITDFRIISAKKELNSISSLEKDNLRKGLQKERFEELIKIRNGKSRIDFMILEKNGIVTDFMMLVDDDDEFVVLSFQGEIDLDHLGEITKNMEIDGMEHLQELKK